MELRLIDIEEPLQVIASDCTVPTSNPNAWRSSLSMSIFLSCFFFLCNPVSIFCLLIGSKMLIVSSSFALILLYTKSLKHFSPISSDDKRSFITTCSISTPDLKCLAGPSRNGSKYSLSWLVRSLMALSCWFRAPLVISLWTDVVNQRQFFFQCSSYLCHQVTSFDKSISCIF